MRRAFLFMKRNLLEMIRDPLLYVFCVGFPLAMTLLFQIIVHNVKDVMPIFEIKSLIPGIMMFSYSLLMLVSSLLISKDKASNFVKRLFTSPMKSYEFIIGYFIPFFIVGLSQTAICLIMGYIFGGIDGIVFASFPHVLLLVITMIPIMIINISLGMLFGTILNDKSAPAISSIFISCSGIIGGAWMPMETMGGFETVASIFPFYPSTYLGRVVLGATHLAYDLEGNLIIPLEVMTLGNRGIIYIIEIIAYMLVITALSLIIFHKKMSSD